MPFGPESSFAPAFWLLTGERRAALVALHRFCRAADHAVDEATSPAQAAEAVVTWRGEVDAMYGTGTPRTSEARALAPVARHYGMHKEDFDRLLSALEDDARATRYAREADFARYCDGVAGAPGCLSLAIFGCPEARTYAEALGRALQLTNVLRDLRADLRAGRVYLPLEDLSRFGLTAEMLLEAARDGASAAAGLPRLVRFERERAHDWYAVADRTYHAQPRAARRRLGSARAMQSLYRALLDRLEQVEVLPAGRPRPSTGAVLAGVAHAALEAAIA
jgi:phytoene synthase